MIAFELKSLYSSLPFRKEYQVKFGYSSNRKEILRKIIKKEFPRSSNFELNDEDGEVQFENDGDTHYLSLTLKDNDAY